MQQIWHYYKSQFILNKKSWFIKMITSVKLPFNLFESQGAVLRWGEEFPQTGLAPQMWHETDERIMQVQNERSVAFKILQNAHNAPPGSLIGREGHRGNPLPIPHSTRRLRFLGLVAGALLSPNIFV